MNIFISHAVEDHQIAQQWQALISGLTAGFVETWFSSDVSAGGGMPGGRVWRDVLLERLRQSSVIIAILTHNSVDRPWIYWECGAAAGLNNQRLIFPIFYAIGRNEVPGPLTEYQTYDGFSRTEVRRVCEQVCLIANKNAKINTRAFSPLYRIYESRVHQALIVKNDIAFNIDLHSRYINDFDWLKQNDTLFATASEDESLKVATVDGTTSVHSFRAQAAVKCIACASDYATLIYGIATGEVFVRQLEPQSVEERVVFTHPLVRALEYTPGHNLIASGGYDKCLRIVKLQRDFTTIELINLRRSGPVRAIAWAFPMLQLAFGNGAEVEILTLSARLAATSDPERLFGHTGNVLALSWNKDNSLLASGDEHGNILIWNPLSKKHVARVDRSSTLDAVRTLSFHPTLAGVLAAGGKSGVIEIITLSENGAPSVREVGRFGTFINRIRWFHGASALLFACGGAIKSLKITTQYNPR